MARFLLHQGGTKAEPSMINVAINGLGRIGRAVLKIVLDTPELELVAVNDLAEAANLAYLISYDTVYGRYKHSVRAENGSLFVESRRFAALREKDPARLPWRAMAVDVVFECTGAFKAESELAKHIEAGAKTVLLSAPSKSEDVPTIVHGVNTPTGGTQIVSCASCTTNCITPIVEIVGRRIGIAKAVMTSLHAYTASQAVVDAPSRSFRRGRAAGANLVPTSTGAAMATTRALPDYAARFDGVAVRAPVPVGSIADITFVTTRRTTVEEVNRIFMEESKSSRYQDIVGVTDDPIVSSDIIADPRAAVVDSAMTMVVDGDLLKILAWYDNEWGYANQMVREALALTRTRRA
jgi:glyceraldehyde 3-phosphate dehydrogenase